MFIILRIAAMWNAFIEFSVCPFQMNVLYCPEYSALSKCTKFAPIANIRIQLPLRIRRGMIMCPQKNRRSRIMSCIRCRAEMQSDQILVC